MAEEPTESAALSLVKWIADKGIEGVGPLTSAQDLAAEYEANPSYSSTEERIDALIAWESSKNAIEGFLTGLGGIITLPVTIPASISVSWLYQARLAATIAILSGATPSASQMRTLATACLLGNALEEILRNAGVAVGKKITIAMINKIPGRILIEINKKIGFRLITKAGEKGIINLTKWVPFLGGVVGAAIDAAACRSVGKVAKQLFFEGEIPSEE